MAAGRNQVAYDDIDYGAITVKADGVTITFDATQANGIPAAILGRAVTWSANDTVALAVDGDYILGKLLKLEYTAGIIWATVQNDGMLTLPGGASATLTRGAPVVGALDGSSNKGFVRAAASAAAAELIKMNGHIVNNADTANVVIDFD